MTKGITSDSRVEKLLFIIAGANGVGKTTFAKDFAKTKKLKFLNADEIALKLNNNPEKVRIKAGKLFLKQISDCMRENRSFVIESTLSGKYLKNIINNAQGKGYQVIIVYIFVENPDICIKRIKNRVLKGGHFVADEDVKRRFLRSVKLFYNEYRFLADLCYLINNTDDDFEEIAIFEQENVLILNENIYDKFLGVIENEEY